MENWLVRNDYDRFASTTMHYDEVGDAHFTEYRVSMRSGQARDMIAENAKKELAEKNQKRYAKERDARHKRTAAKLAKKG